MGCLLWRSGGREGPGLERSRNKVTVGEPAVGVTLSMHIQKCCTRASPQRVELLEGLSLRVELLEGLHPLQCFLLESLCPFVA
jgi:hypothetical protein